MVTLLYVWSCDVFGYISANFSVSDHALLWLKNQEKVQCNRDPFKFINCVMDMEGYAEKVTKNWR